MNLECFDGLSQMKQDQHEKILYECIENDCYYYLSLILKYCDKNIDAIKNGLKLKGDYNALFALLKRKELKFQKQSKKEWLQLLLDISEKSKQMIDIWSLKDAFNKYLKVTPYNNDAMYKSMLQQYIKRNTN